MRAETDRIYFFSPFFLGGVLVFAGWRHIVRSGGGGGGATPGRLGW